MYTDGVTDLPPPHALAPEEVCEIVDEAAKAASSADEVAAYLGHALEARLPFTMRNDDIALLVLRILPDGSR